MLPVAAFIAFWVVVGLSVFWVAVSGSSRRAPERARRASPGVRRLGIFLFFVNQLSWRSIDGLQLGNIFNIFALRDDADIRSQQMFACAWLVLAAFLNAGWFWRQVKNFQPAAPGLPESSPPRPPLAQ